MLSPESFQQPVRLFIGFLPGLSIRRICIAECLSYNQHSPEQGAAYVSVSAYTSTERRSHANQRVLRHSGPGRKSLDYGLGAIEAFFHIFAAFSVRLMSFALLWFIYNPLPWIPAER